jgi:hypothetical protein
MFLNRKGRSKTGKDVLKQENDVLKQEIWSFFLIFLIHFVPGCPGTEQFVPGQRDTGTRFFFVPGQRDNETSRPVETLVYNCIQKF